MSKSTLGTTTVTQVAIVTKNIEAKARAWAELLGVPVPDIQETGAEAETQIRYEGRGTPARAKLAFFKLGQVSLELIEPIGRPSTWGDQLDQHGDSLHHIAFNVEGMGETLVMLAEKGIPLVQRGEFKNGRYAYVDGIAELGATLELLEHD
jgi:methylmalonyl-CoA/ethylmalonyl-CoA epimerase